MAATNVSHADSHQPGAIVSQLGVVSQPDHAHGPQATISKDPGDQNLSVTFTEMNSNIGLLTKFLKQFVEGGGSVKNRSLTRRSRKRRQSLTSSDVSASEDSDDPQDGNKRHRCNDKLSLRPSDDDMDQLLRESGAMCTTDGSEVANKTEDENYLQTLEADLNDEDPVGRRHNSPEFSQHWPQALG